MHIVYRSRGFVEVVVVTTAGSDSPVWTLHCVSAAKGTVPVHLRVGADVFVPNRRGGLEHEHAASKSKNDRDHVIEMQVSARRHSIRSTSVFELVQGSAQHGLCESLGSFGFQLVGASESATHVDLETLRGTSGHGRPWYGNIMKRF